MERDSFIFYRSFHEAIKCMNEKVQSQIYAAIADYALDGIEPTNLCKEAQGMFLLMRPLIDANNTKYQNGKKGGRPRKNPVPVSIPPQYSCSFKEEAEKMKGDEIWLDAVCMQNHIDRGEILRRIEAFPIHCEAECADKPHKDYGDAKKHFCSWMRKAYAKDSEPKKTDKAAKSKGSSISLKELDEQAKKRNEEFERQKSAAVKPRDFIRRRGYDPDKVTLANVCNPEWVAKNPPTLPPLSG